MSNPGIRHYTLFAALALLSAVALANDYGEQRAAAIRKCQATDPKEHHTGLALNPDGYRSYYLRSLCYQKAAIKFRDPGLCAQVRQRRALFSSSWGYSKSNCRKLVAGGIDKDRETLDAMKEQYDSGHIRITDFTVERNGNGRDFDIIPRFAGDGEHAYQLDFEIIRDESGAAPVPLYTSGFYLKGAENNIRLFVTQAELRKRFPEFRLDSTYAVRATLTYSTGYGSQAGKWSDTFIESRFPVAERSQSLVKEVTFGREWKPVKYP